MRTRSLVKLLGLVSTVSVGALELHAQTPEAVSSPPVAAPSVAAPSPAPNRRAHPVLSPVPTRSIAGPGAELIAQHAPVLTAIEQALELLKDPNKRKEADQAFAKVVKDLDGIAKQADALAKQNTAQAAALEADAKDKKEALAHAPDLAAKADAVDEEVAARRRVIDQNNVAIQLQGSSRRQHEAIKELQAGAVAGDAAKIKAASASFSFELHRIASALNPGGS